MKIRLGFVSNSSSSSYTLIVTKKAHEEALEKCTPFERAVAIEIMGKESKTLNSMEVFVGSTWQDAGGNGTLNWMQESGEFSHLEPEEEDEWEDPYYLAFNKYEEYIPKDQYVTGYTCDG